MDPIPNPNTSVHVDGWVNAGYTKLQLWGLTQFKKVVYIDADCLVQENVDEVWTTLALSLTAPPSHLKLLAAVRNPGCVCCGTRCVSPRQVQRRRDGCNARPERAHCHACCRVDFTVT